MARAGSQALSVFTSALNARVLLAHNAGPLRPGELEKALGWAPQSSLRAAVSKLCDLGAIARVEPLDGSSGTATELTVAGRELLPVSCALERWLQSGPGEPVPLDDAAAHGIVKALTAAWDSTVVRALAERPQTLLELNTAISDLNYPALKRRLAKLRSTDLVVPVQTANGSAYTASDWLRRAVVPLTLAGQWERRHEVGERPISRVEVETAFLLALPLIELSGKTSGTCSLAVLTSEDPTASNREVASLAVEVKQGRIVSYNAGAKDQSTWALGSIDAWLAATIEGDIDGLRISGTKPRLAQVIVKALHADLFR